MPRRSAHGIVTLTDDPEGVVKALPVILAAQFFGDNPADKLMIGPEIYGPVHFNLHWLRLADTYKRSPAEKSTDDLSCQFLDSSQTRRTVRLSQEPFYPAAIAVIVT